MSTLASTSTPELRRLAAADPGMAMHGHPDVTLDTLVALTPTACEAAFEVLADSRPVRRG